ncbi:MAG: helix-turn-helix transcriptional regulator [Rhodospirillaceae bacterium]
MSEKRINAVFREMYGGTVFEVLRDARLTIAREMLETGDAPIKSVSWDVGYAHVSNFNRAFSRMFGVTPGAILKNKGK